MPHITAGLDRGMDSGVDNALRIIAGHPPGFVVFNALMSSEGDDRSPARLLEVLRLAREILPETMAMGVGCMRPRGELIPAKLVDELGIVSVAMAPKGLIKELKRMGIAVSEKGGCCAFWTNP